MYSSASFLFLSCSKARASIIIDPNIAREIFLLRPLILSIFPEEILLFCWTALRNDNYGDSYVNASEISSIREHYSDKHWPFVHQQKFHHFNAWLTLKILSSSQKTFFRLLVHNVSIHNIMKDHHTTITTKKIRNEFSSRPWCMRLYVVWMAYIRDEKRNNRKD